MIVALIASVLAMTSHEPQVIGERFHRFNQAAKGSLELRMKRNLLAGVDLVLVNHGRTPAYLIPPHGWHSLRFRFFNEDGAELNLRSRVTLTLPRPSPHSRVIVQPGEAIKDTVSFATIEEDYLGLDRVVWMVAEYKASEFCKRSFKEYGLRLDDYASCSAPVKVYDDRWWNVYLR